MGVKLLSAARQKLLSKLTLRIAGLIIAFFGQACGARSEVLVEPGSDLTRLVANSSPGTAFILLPGKHYAGDIVPKDRQTFEGRSGAILSGAVQLGPFIRNGQYWRASGPPPLPPSHGSCERGVGATASSCLLREDLFIDDVPLHRVLALSQVHAGTWYQSRDTGEVFSGSDPGGHVVELSYRSSAFNGEAHEVTIRHLTVEQYASVAQHGAIEGVSSSGWSVLDNTIRFNAGTGIHTGKGMRVASNLVTTNGQLGIRGEGDDLLIERNNITNNNTHNFDPAWEAGATKFWATNDLLFVRNCVHDNAGAGIWMDTDNRNALVVGNWSFNNSGVGIFYEISGRGFIANNVSALNGSPGNSPWGAQILISGSLDTLVWHNRIAVASDHGQGIFIVQERRSNDSKIISDLPRYDSRGDSVVDNTITFLGNAGTSGFYDNKGDASPLTAINRFEGNKIVVRKDDEIRRFRVGNRSMDLTKAAAIGQEIGSQLVTEMPESVPEFVCPGETGRHPAEN